MFREMENFLKGKKRFVNAYLSNFMIVLYAKLAASTSEFASNGRKVIS